MPATERTPTTEEAKEQKEWDRTSRRAYATIALAISEDCRVHITGIKDPEAMWNKLKALFDVKGYTARYLTFKELVTTTLERSASVTAYIDSIKRCGQKLNDMGSAVDSWILTSILLYNLGEAYDSFVAFTLRTVQTVSQISTRWLAAYWMKSGTV